MRVYTTKALKLFPPGSKGLPCLPRPAYPTREGLPEEDANPFRYCGEYWDDELGCVYLRARYYEPDTGRFLREDSHWNPGNMVYGDKPQKINERKDSLGLNVYTLVPDIYAIRQSTNLYVYGVNNPVIFIDPSGEFILTAIIIGAVAGAIIGGAIGNYSRGDLQACIIMVDWQACGIQKI